MATLLIAGCGDHGSLGKRPTIDGWTPRMPVPTAGSASLMGHVRGADGQAVYGATIKVAETDATVSTDEAGAYEIAVPSESTVTLVATATGFASTFHESVMLASQSTITDFDLLLLVPDRVTAINALGAPGQEKTRGLVAVRLHSLDPSCVAAGAEVRVWPPLAATVVYSRPGTEGAIDEPDTALTGVQPGAEIDLWLAATVPPGNGIVIDVSQPGCQLMTQSFNLGGVEFSVQRQVVAQSVTQTDLFLGLAP